MEGSLICKLIQLVSLKWTIWSIWFLMVDFNLKSARSFNIRHPNGHRVLGICRTDHITFISFFKRFEVNVHISTLDNKYSNVTYDSGQSGFFEIKLLFTLFNGHSLVTLLQLEIFLKAPIIIIFVGRITGLVTALSKIETVIFCIVHVGVIESSLILPILPGL